jgi:hypothetical protein
MLWPCDVCAGVKVSTPSDYTRVLPSGETVVPSKVRSNTVPCCSVCL